MTDDQLDILKARLALPAARCRLCGDVVRRGTGTRLPEDIFSAMDSQRLTVAEMTRQQRGKPIIDFWRRAHRQCVPDLAAVVSRIIGRDVTPSIAAEVSSRSPVRLVAFQRFPLIVDPYAFHEPPSVDDVTKPFGWITPQQVKHLRRLVDDARDAGKPKRCLDGACGICGVALSPVWTATELTWNTGDPAPACEDCWRLYELYGQPSSVMDPEHARVIGVRLLTGYADEGQPDHGMHLFAEVATPDERAGYPQPWMYRPDQLRAVREAVWDRHPDLIPAGDDFEHYRQHADAFTRARDAALAARIHEPDPWSMPSH